MPRLNGTGPNGSGPMTGRGLGKCKEALQNRDATPTSNLAISNEEENRYNLCRNQFRNRDAQSNKPHRCGRKNGSRRRLNGN